MKKTTRILFLALTFTLSSCISPPEEFIAPTYDITLSFPITDTLFTINEFIKDDSSIVASNDPNKLGILVYSHEESIDPFYVGDNLTLNSFATSASASVGPIKLNDVPPVETEIALSDWAPVSGESEMVFPEISNQVQSEFNLINEFESAKLSSAKLDITIQNNLPIETEFQNLKIVNKNSGTIFVQTPNNAPIVTQPFSSSQITLDIADKSISNNLEVQGTLYTPGSGSETVTVNSNASTAIVMDIYNLEIESVTGNLPAQDPITISDSFIIDDSTEIEEIRFDSGNFQIVMNNFLDLDLQVELKVNNLFDANNNMYEESFILSKSELDRKIEIASLKDWKIRATTTGSLTNELTYSTTITPIATDELITLASDDSVSSRIEFAETSFSYIKGRIKPTSFDVAESDFNFELGDIQNNFSFDSLFISNPTMILDLSSSVNFGLLLNAEITGKSTNIEKKLQLDIDLPPRVQSQFDLNDYGFTEFVNSFTLEGEIPNNFILSGVGTVNPNSNIGSISKSDSITGKLSIEIPLDFGISGGSFIDTIYVDSLDIDDETIDAINFLEITIETLNKIPANIVINGNILDKNNKPLFSFPPSNNEQDYILIDAPKVDGNGNFLSAEMVQQTIILIGDDAKAFVQNPNLALKFSLNTPPFNSASPVKFKKTDEIYFKIYGKVDYKLNNN